MNVYLPLFILILNVLFVKCSDDNEDDEVVVTRQGLDHEKSGKSSGASKWPQRRVPSSSEYSEETRAADDFQPEKDPFWGNPVAYQPPWESPDQQEPRYPFFDSSYPMWVPGNGKGSKKKDSAKQSSSDEEAEIPGYVQKQLNAMVGQNVPKIQLSGAQDPEEVDTTNVMDESEIKQYVAELKAADPTRLLGINQHHYQPETYRLYDLGRRFVPQYPYTEVNQNDLNQEEDPSLIPKRAPPELVMAIAKESALIQSAQPVDPDEHIVKKESLRTGNYWNSYWKEDVDDPTKALRSPKRNKLDTIKAKLSPGSPIYEYVSKLNKLYPKLLYVINKQKHID